MIYLLDDNKDNKRSLFWGGAYVDDNTFAGYLTSIDRLELNADLSFLKKAKCLLVHKSTEDTDSTGQFINGSTTNAQKLIEDVSDYGERIPLVTFTNEITGSPFKNQNYIGQINKSLFYQQRLFPFLNHYKKTNEIELRIIVFGENFMAVEASQYARELIEAVAMYPKQEVLNLSYIPSLASLRQFHEFMQPDGDFNEFVNNLEDNPIRIATFVNNIRRVIESMNDNYGKNTYTWQN